MRCGFPCRCMNPLKNHECRGRGGRQLGLQICCVERRIRLEVPNHAHHSSPDGCECTLGAAACGHAPNPAIVVQCRAPARVHNQAGSHMSRDVAYRRTATRCGCWYARRLDFHDAVLSMTVDCCMHACWREESRYRGCTWIA